MKENKIYSCSKHIDDAIDDFINDNEIFPTVTKDKDSICVYCKERSEYCISSER